MHAKIERMRHLTVRNIPPEVAEGLEAEKHRRRASLNETVISLLARALAVDARQSNGLRELAGGWTEADAAAFDAAVASTGASSVDEELWR
jgi:hypothetical protein